jgi:hypothetical protein
MPKTYPKTPQKKNKIKNKRVKDQPKPFSIFKSKYYWVAVTAVIFVFAVAMGFVTRISLGSEVLILGSILSVIAFAFYLGFKSPEGYDKRATFIFVGASIVGFSIWAVMVLSFNAAGITPKISDAVGNSLFAITSLMICLVFGAFIGDLLGKNREALDSLYYRFRNW